jgi:hypothetical protein
MGVESNVYQGYTSRQFYTNYKSGATLRKLGRGVEKQINKDKEIKVTYKTRLKNCTINLNVF